MKIGSLYKEMGIRGTFQVSQGSLECAKNFKHLGQSHESKAVCDLIGELDMLKLQTRTHVLAIDTGSRVTGFCHFQICKDGEQPYRLIDFGIVNNQELLTVIEDKSHCAIVMENFQSMGMAVGRSVFESCIWLGRFIETARRSHSRKPVFLMYRPCIKLEICGSSRAKDKNVRQSIIDMFDGSSGGGKCPQIGTKKQKGPLYGVSSHVWSALAVGISLDKIMSNY
jgi:hypothetical protein